MKRRNLLLVMVLAVMFLVASSFSYTGNTAQAFGCTQFCANNYNACMIECNGDPGCQYWCWLEYDCCMNMCNNIPTCQ